MRYTAAPLFPALSVAIAFTVIVLLPIAGSSFRFNVNGGLAAAPISLSSIMKSIYAISASALFAVIVKSVPLTSLAVTG